MKANPKHTSFQKEERQLMRAHRFNTFLPLPLMALLILFVESILSSVFSWYDGTVSSQTTAVFILIKALCCAGLIRVIFKIT